eukprot:Gb_05854 [translate_table: standard]
MKGNNRAMGDSLEEDEKACSDDAGTPTLLTEQKIHLNLMSGRGPRRHGPTTTTSGHRNPCTNREWNWLASKFEEMRPVKHSNPRKGELPEDIVRSIWRDDSDPTKAKVPVESLKKWALEISNLTAARKKREKRKDKVPMSIMDVLLQNWTYFNHSHADTNNVHKHVHAKYCENEFGHFQLLNGQQVHVCYNVPVKSLEIPTLKAPVQEEIPEFDTPPMPPMPQLYPIDGMLPLPSEEDADIPQDLPMPVFKAPIPTEYPPLVLPQPLKAPALMLPVMKNFEEDESTIDYESYREEKLPNLVLPEQEPLPLWEEPSLAGMPELPVFLEPEPISPPALQKIHPYQLPELDAKPCERAYYDIDDGETGICDGLCCTHRYKDTSPTHPDDPCQAKAPPLPTPPPPPFSLPLQPILEPALELPAEEQPPPFEAPYLIEDPVYEPPPKPDLPPWKNPPPPPYIGWLGGQRPVFLIDCSGTMAGARMKYVLNCMKTLLSPGGQVEVAATHFDIIAYSFDAWSFGTLQNNRKYGSTMCTVKYMEVNVERILKYYLETSTKVICETWTWIAIASPSILFESLFNAFFYTLLDLCYLAVVLGQPMQLKTASSLEAAMRWTMQLKPYGGTSVIRALDEALSRTFADCIYFFTDGKPDRPVHVMEALKIAEKKRGYAIPMYTVGLCATGAGARFLTRISDATGGRYINADVKKNLQPPILEGEALKDMVWTQSMIEAKQRKNAEAGVQEDIAEIIERVRSQFGEARQQPRFMAHEEKVRLAMQEHASRLEEIKKQNEERMIQAREAYNQLVQEISERNKKNRDAALKNWKEEVNKIQLKNQEIFDAMEQWKKDVAEIECQIAEIRSEAKHKFLQDLKEVAEKNRLKIEKSEEEHGLYVRRVRERNEFVVAEYERKEKDLIEKVKALNKATQEDYDTAMATVRASNKSLLERTRADYDEKIAAIQAKNIKRIKDAEMAYEKKCEKIKLENAGKQEALANKLSEIKARNEAAIAAHQIEVARTIQEHEVKLKEYTQLNLENEENARKNWRMTCQEIDRQNMAAVKRAMEDYDEQQKAVQQENLKLAQLRDEFHKRVREIEIRNNALVKKKKAEWKIACSKLENQFYEQLAVKKEEHAKLVEQITSRNEAAMQNALREHQESIAAVEAYNEAIRPVVEASNAVLEEVQRIESFVTCIGDACSPDEQTDEPKPRKRRLENALNLLSSSEKIVNTQMLIEALQVAYKLGTPDENGDPGNNYSSSNIPGGSSNDKCLCNLLPIHPHRVNSHNCNASEDAKDPWLVNSSFP